jgi:formamidopyrimidine-DNA glycosylase
LLVGRRFLAVEAGAQRLRRQSPVAELRRWVAGRRLRGLRRRGKYLLFDLEGGATLLMHLGMTGRLLAGPAPTPALDHIHLVFRLEGGLDLVFQDTRRFGQVLVFPPGVEPPPLAQVGVEPFSRKVTPAWLLERARGRSRPVKNFLLDGRLVAGIGNIYAGEILFAAALHPATPVARLTLADWDRVLAATRRILQHAIRKGGTTVADYLDSRGQTGLFQLELKVYGRTGEPCQRCGAPIARSVQAGRSSFFCPGCQKRQG